MLPEKNTEEREKEFHDNLYDQEGHGDREGAVKYYSVTRRGKTFLEDQVRAHCKGKKALEYGCGPGGLAYLLAKEGSNVTAIDISDVAIQRGKDAAKEEGLKIKFRSMNAEQMDFADNSFDLVCGSGIIHHLELDKAYAEIVRVLKPGGTAVFLEPLGHNPLINLYRHLTPAMRSPDEHPLRVDDFKLAETYFGRVEVRYFNLFSLALVPLRKLPFFSHILSFGEAVDRALFTVLPFLRKHAWFGGIVLSDPRTG